MEPSASFQRRLDAIEAGEPGALQDAITVAYADLRKQSKAVAAGQTCVADATSLLDDALGRILTMNAKAPLSFAGPGQFFAYTSRAIRNCLIDRIRRRKSQPQPVSLDGHDVPRDLRRVDFLDLHDALEKLGDLNERMREVTEGKFLAGMTNGEVAQLFGLSEKAIEKDWTFAKAWLAQCLGGGDDTRPVSAGP